MSSVAFVSLSCETNVMARLSIDSSHYGNLSVVFIGERSGPGNAKYVSYRITGISDRGGVNTTEISDLFDRALQNTQIPGIESVSVSG